jgi:hypothetical protein
VLTSAVVADGEPIDSTLRASDPSGNNTETTTGVRANNAFPTGTVSPARGTSMHGGAVTITLTDVSSDVVRVVSSDGAALTAAPWRFPWQAVDRAKSPSFDLYDEAGNKTTLAHRDDGTNRGRRAQGLGRGRQRRLTFLCGEHRQQAAGARLAQPRPAATDRNGVARVQLLVNGKVVATDSKAGYSFALNPKKYGKTFTVQLRAYDKAGNVRYTGKLTHHR